MPTTHFHASNHRVDQRDTQRWMIFAMRGWMANDRTLCTACMQCIDFGELRSASDTASPPLISWFSWWRAVVRWHLLLRLRSDEIIGETNNTLIFALFVYLSVPSLTIPERTIYLTTSEMMFKQWCSIKTNAYFINSQAGLASCSQESATPTHFSLNQQTATETRRVVLLLCIIFIIVSISTLIQNSLIYEERTCWFSSSLCYVMSS